MKKQLIILGAGVMQGPAIRIAKDMGLEAVVADADPHAPCVSLADRFDCIDLKDKAGIEALARSLQKAGSLAGIMTAGTDFSATVAWVAEKCGLPGIPYEAALNASDKERMRSCFKRAGVPSPAFLVVSRVPDGGKAAAPFAFPAVVKPVDNMGGRGCRRVDTGSELQDAVADALKFSRSGRVIIEEYMEGPEFSVDAIVYRGEITIAGLADRHIVFPPYFIEMGHTMPTNLGPAAAENLLAVFKAGVHALGITDGAAKGDVKLTPRGPMIGEIAARLSGGYMSGWTYPYASGVEATRAAIQVAIGEKPAGLTPARNWTSAERAFISIPGKVRSIHGVEEARQSQAPQGEQQIPQSRLSRHQAQQSRPLQGQPQTLPPQPQPSEAPPPQGQPQSQIPQSTPPQAGIRDIFLRVKAGDRLRFPENNVSKAGNIIAVAPTREEAVAQAECAARSILIRLEPNDPETDAFLITASSFPPDAFVIPESIRLALEKLPKAVDTKKQKYYSYTITLAPFPEFTNSGIKDYAGRTIQESLNAVRLITGLPLLVAETSADEVSSTPVVLGGEFWSALIRGGYQGAAYAVDQVTGNKEEVIKKVIEKVINEDRCL
jgi:biotin carboxylase